MQAIVRSGKSGAWRPSKNEVVLAQSDPDGSVAHISAVISNQPQAHGLAWAQSEGIPTRVVDHRSFADRASFDLAMADALDEEQADLIVLAGFMRILGSALVRRFEGRMINIHPSLLPTFKGLHTHAAALKAGVKVHGATVHLVSPELDSGAVLAQAVVPVLESDTVESLTQAVLQAEHMLYPKVVGWLARGEMILSKDGYRWRDADQAQAQSFWVGR